MKKLATIQKELKAPKNQKNTFGNYNYRNCEDILEALKPLLDEDDKFFISDDIVLIGDRFYVKATATFNDTTVTAFAREALDKKGMDASQITGSTSSYARKYALNALFAIDDTKDSDSTNTHGKEESKPVKTYPKPQPTNVDKAISYLAKISDPEEKTAETQRLLASDKYSESQKKQILAEIN